jgi:hypothetical protein
MIAVPHGVQVLRALGDRPVEDAGGRADGDAGSSTAAPLGSRPA